jgi:hypothetical protein
MLILYNKGGNMLLFGVLSAIIITCFIIRFVMFKIFVVLLIITNSKNYSEEIPE